MVFDPYVKRLMRKQFHSFHLLGSVPHPDEALPIILIGNHNTWWDGFFVYYLNELLFKRKLHLLMLEEQLKKYSFFARVGAVGFDPSSIADTRRMFNYMDEILHTYTKNKPLLCLFPQGVLTSWQKRPLNFKGGILKIINRYDGPINLVQFGAKAEFINEQRAEVYFNFSENRIIDSLTQLSIARLEEVQLNLLNTLQHEISEQENGRIILSGKKSVSQTIDELSN